ncbi:MAG: hypothetical protein HY801_07485 [Candidatus Lindowbacteria bacterium]|nr:hypothetical protein [Candidatus Lindowbacteria bacterium]
MNRICVAWLSAAVLLFLASPAISHEVEPEDAAHPLRVAAYVLHPVGEIVYQVVVRPLHLLVSQPGLQELFGHREDVFEQKIWEPGVCKPLVTPGPVLTPLPQQPEGEAVQPEEAPQGLTEGPEETVEPQGEKAPEGTSQPEIREEIFPTEPPTQPQLDADPGEP